MRINFKYNGGNFWAHGPEKCPHCGKDLSVEVLTTIQSPTNSWEYASILCCKFCGKFSYIDVLKPPSTQFCRKSNFYPQKAIFDLPEGIEEYYPKFVDIYMQSLNAEALNLKDICGMGFRKALKILVRQYVFDKNPNDIEKFKSYSLSNLIDTIKNPTIKELSTKLRRLGNDQTHTGYLKNPDYGVDDIKSFLKALCYYILMEKKYETAKTSDIK